MKQDSLLYWIVHHPAAITVSLPHTCIIIVSLVHILNKLGKQFKRQRETMSEKRLEYIQKIEKTSTMPSCERNRSRSFISVLRFYNFRRALVSQKAILFATFGFYCSISSILPLPFSVVFRMSSFCGQATGHTLWPRNLFLKNKVFDHFRTFFRVFFGVFRVFSVCGYLTAQKLFFENLKDYISTRWLPAPITAVSGVLGHCFEGPVVCVVSNMWGQCYEW